MKILQLKTSIFDSNTSISNRLSDELTEAMSAILASRGEPVERVTRDLEQSPIPHLDSAWLEALSTPPQERSEKQRARVAFSDSLIAELKAADVVIIGAPMYNFTVPSMLKAWIDHVARAGTTFQYTEQGPVGLLNDKTVYVVTAMGGLHEVGQSDFVRPYLQTALGLMGLSKVQFVTASGLNMGPEKREQGIAQARERIAALAEGGDKAA